MRKKNSVEACFVAFPLFSIYLRFSVGCIPARERPASPDLSQPRPVALQDKRQRPACGAAGLAVGNNGTATALARAPGAVGSGHLRGGSADACAGVK